MKKRKRKRQWFIVGLLSLLVVGSTFSFFSAEGRIENKFHSTEARIYLNEKFNPNDRWVPGEEKQKEVWFGNDGNMAAVLRIRFEKSLEGINGISETITDKIQLNFADDFDIEWEQHGEWYYYKKVLEPSMVTGITLKSVTISDKLSNGENGILKNYSNSIFDVSIKGELLQASLGKETAQWQQWEWIPEIINEKVVWKQRN